MTRYRITTPYGTVYECTETGNVTRYNEHRWNDGHDSWKFLGAASAHNFASGRVVATLSELANRSDLRHKNGRPKYTLADLDHGTRRTHGNVKYHGIATVVTL
jgi:hypothetical protein